MWLATTMARKSIKMVAIFSILQFSATKRKWSDFVRSCSNKGIKSVEFGVKYKEAKAMLYVLIFFAFLLEVLGEKHGR
jgi:hypothetical protein